MGWALKTIKKKVLLVESPPICVDDFQYIAEGAEGMQMLEFMFTGCEANVN